MESERLNYRKLEQTDFEPYKSWYMDAKVMELITGAPLTFEQVEERFEKALKTNRSYPDMGWYLVHLLDSGSFAGIVKLTPMEPYVAEVGYGLLPDFWGNGYGKEMLKAVVEHAVRLKTIHELVGIVHPENLASRKILEQQQFSFLNQKDGQFGPSDYFQRVL